MKELQNIETRILKHIEAERRQALTNIRRAKRFENVNGWTNCHAKDNYTPEERRPYIRATLTKLQATKPLEKQREILSAKINKTYDKNIDKARELIERMRTSYAPNFSIQISVDWVRNTYWGNNPHARVTYYDGERSITTEGTASGCGYDKGSTAIANALNQCAPIKALLYHTYSKALKRNKDAKPADVLGYGAGYLPYRPYFEGGCGVSTIENIFKACGYTMTHTGWGDTWDAYTIEPTRKK